MEQYAGRNLAFSLYLGPANKEQFPTRGYQLMPRGLTEHICSSPWSPVIYKGGYRKQENFCYADWCVLDFDEGATIEDALVEFSDFAHIIATTKSHTNENHRFRVCLPFAKRVRDLSTYRTTMRVITDRYRSDPAAKDGARFFYPCQEIVSINGWGRAIPLEHENPKKKVKPRKVSVWKNGVLPPKLERMLNRPPPVEGEVNTTLYCLACEFARRTSMGVGEIRKHVEHLIWPNPANEPRYEKTIASALRRYRG